MRPHSARNGSQFYLIGGLNVEETINLIVQLISNVGFPIACVCAMFYFWNKEREDHKEENRQWVEALNNNTQAMNSLMELVKKDG